MPMLTTVRIRLPVWPRQAPLRTALAKRSMRPRTSCTSGTMLRPSTLITAPAGARSAMCSTARFSVRLIASPANMALRWFATPHSAARSKSASMMAPSTRFFE